MKGAFGWIGIGVGLAVAGAAVGAVKLRNERPIVVINGEKITRAVFIGELEKRHGVPVLRQMLQEKLVMQAAKKKNLMPTPAEVQAELAELRERDPDMDRQLRLNGKTVQDLTADVEGRIALARLRTADVKLPKDEVKKLWATNQKRFRRSEGRKVSMILAKDGKTAEKARRLLTDGIPAEFAAQNEGMALPGNRSQTVLYRGQLPPAFEKPVFSLKPGTVSSVLPVGKNFAVVKSIEEIPPQQKRFEDVEQDLTIGLKLRKAKSEPEFLQALQKESKIEFKSDRYKGLADVALGADLRPRKVAKAR